MVFHENTTSMKKSYILAGKRKNYYHYYYTLFSNTKLKVYKRKKTRIMICIFHFDRLLGIQWMRSFLRWQSASSTNMDLGVALRYAPVIHVFLLYINPLFYLLTESSGFRVQLGRRELAWPEIWVELSRRFLTKTSSSSNLETVIDEFIEDNKCVSALSVGTVRVIFSKM